MNAKNQIDLYYLSYAAGTTESARHCGLEGKHGLGRHGTLRVALVVGGHSLGCELRETKTSRRAGKGERQR